jgi:hypothetical protein
VHPATGWGDTLLLMAQQGHGLSAKTAAQHDLCCPLLKSLCGFDAAVLMCPRWHDAAGQTINFITEYFTSGNLRQ